MSSDRRASTRKQFRLGAEDEKPVAKSVQNPLQSEVTNGAPSGPTSTLCRHERLAQDPDSLEVFCQDCGEQQPEPVEGSIPTVKRLRDLARTLRILNAEPLLRAREDVAAAAARLQDHPCQSPGCRNPAAFRSKWCPTHKMERERSLARDRQRVHRLLRHGVWPRESRRGSVA
jgi:hypothetical protein